MLPMLGVNSRPFSPLRRSSFVESRQGLHTLLEDRPSVQTLTAHDPKRECRHFSQLTARPWSPFFLPTNHS